MTRRPRKLELEWGFQWVEGGCSVERDCSVAAGGGNSAAAAAGPRPGQGGKGVAKASGRLGGSRSLSPSIHFMAYE